MRRVNEVGAVLLWLVGCGAGYVRDQEPAQPGIRLANATDDNPDCPAGTYGLRAPTSTASAALTTGSTSPSGGDPIPGMVCQTCGDPGGDPGMAVPYGDNYVRALGARRYSFHNNSIRPSINSRLLNSYGQVIGHVSWGGQYIPAGYQGGHPQSFVSAHIYIPGTADIWIRYGRLFAQNGQSYPWVAVRDGASSGWSRYMTPAGFRAWMVTLPAAKQTALVAAAQTGETTRKNNPFSPRINDFFNEDGSCNGTGWAVVLVLALDCEIPAACAGALVTSAYCSATWIYPPYPVPTPPDPNDPNKNPVPPAPPDPVTVDDPIDPPQPVDTGPDDPGGTGGTDGGGTDGDGPYAPEGDGGDDGGGGGCP